MTRLLLTIAIALAIAAPAQAGIKIDRPTVEISKPSTPWWQKLVEARRSTSRYQARQRQAARDRVFARCMAEHGYRADRCVGRR